MNVLSGILCVSCNTDSSKSSITIIFYVFIESNSNGTICLSNIRNVTAISTLDFVNDQYTRILTTNLKKYNSFQDYPEHAKHQFLIQIVLDNFL